MPKRHVTIDDIASAAGVSKTTVSRFINGQEHLLSKPTAMRIRKAIEITGYRPSAAARSLSRGTSDGIGILAALDEAHMPASGNEAHRAASLLHARGLKPDIADIGDGTYTEDEAVRLLASYNVAGILYIGCSPSDGAEPWIPYACAEGGKGLEAAIDELLGTLA